MGGGPRRLGNETRKGADMGNKGGGSGRHVGGGGEGRASGAEAALERYWAHVRLQNEAKTTPSTEPSVESKRTFL